MKKTVETVKNVVVLEKVENVNKEVPVVVLPVIPMTTFKGVALDGTTPIEVNIPKAFTILGKTVTSNVSFEFPFVGNPNNKDRIGKTRVLKFKVVLPQEVDIISQIELGEKYQIIALMKKVEKLKNGLPVIGKEVVSMSIVTNDLQTWFGANLDSQSAIDVIGLISHYTLWSQAHKHYLKVSGRDLQGKNGNSNVEVVELKATDLLQY